MFDFVENTFKDETNYRLTDNGIVAIMGVIKRYKLSRKELIEAVKIASSKGLEAEDTFKYVLGILHTQGREKNIKYAENKHDY